MKSGRQPRYQVPMKRLILCSALALLLGGCEQVRPLLAEAGYAYDLGEFEVERVSFVEKMPGPGDGYDGGGHLKVQLASTQKLSLEYPTYWIGAASDYCPLTDDHKLLAFGYFGDGRSFWDPSGSQTAEKSADGLYRYNIYVVCAYPPPGKTDDDYGTPKTGPYAQSEYDIIADETGLCLQIFGGDHYNVLARSSVIRVSYQAVHRAAVEARMGTTRK